jgi:hypothetical protein
MVNWNLLDGGLSHSGPLPLPSESVWAGTVTPPSRNDGVNQDHVEGFSTKQEFTSTCIQGITVVF